MICTYCERPGVFSPGYYHCDQCVADEAAYLVEQAALDAEWSAEEQAAYEAGEAAFLAEMEAATVMQADLTEDQIEEAIAAAEAHYDRTVNR